MQDGAAHPCELPSSDAGARIDAKFCPSDPQLLAFVRDDDLWVLHRPLGREVRLTNTAARDHSVPRGMSAGKPSYIVQEEFDRFTGYWWLSTPAADNSQCILFEEVDERDVDVLSIPEFSSSHAGSDAFRFPRPGTRNAVTEPKIIDFSTSPDGLARIERRRLPCPLRTLFPDCEYMTRCGWTPDGQVCVRVCFLQLSRELAGTSPSKQCSLDHFWDRDRI